MRNKIVAANWKMNLGYKDGINILKEVSDKLQFNTNTKVIIAASYIHLYEAVSLKKLNSQINIAAQNCSAYDSGAYTSEISAKMIKSCGVKYVILGHSECRDNFNEDNYLLMQKVSQALVVVKRYCKEKKTFILSIFRNSLKKAYFIYLLKICQKFILLMSLYGQLELG